ncbi:MAG: hypothetical protein RL708_1031 [Bacteroidota bacterium]|jgi:hypothetical protein
MKHLLLGMPGFSEFILLILGIGIFVGIGYIVYNLIKKFL